MWKIRKSPGTTEQNWKPEGQRDWWVVNDRAFRDRHRQGSEQELSGQCLGSEETIEEF